MATLGTLCTTTRTFLGTAADDPQYTDAILIDLGAQAYNALLADLHAINPGYLSTTVTLTPLNASSHSYVFASQSPALTDFAGWLEVRHTDQDGMAFTEVRADELTGAGNAAFALTGPDDAPTLTTGPDTDVGINLFFRYVQWPAPLTATTDTPSKIPTRFHDVLALEMAYLGFGLGGEQRMPPELLSRWQDRRGQLMQAVSKRGMMPTLMRLDPSKD